jgi:hypothetical protein
MGVEKIDDLSTASAGYDTLDILRYVIISNHCILII